MSNKLTWIVLIGLIASCKKLVTVPAPVTQLSSENVFSNDATAAAVLTGLYTNLVSGNPVPTGQSFNYISLLCALSADELTLDGGAANANSILVGFYQNALNPGPTNTENASILANCYYDIYTINVTLNRLSVSNGLTSSVKKELTGEAAFLRAFFYFYLVNLYGPVPLVTTSNYADNATLSRSTQLEIYKQIISDLKEAQGLLSDGYVGADGVSPSMERVRPNKWAATAMLARAYLFTGAYDSAEIQSSAVINKVGTYDTTSLNDVFLRNSREAIWQLQPVNAGWNTNDARLFILPSTGPTSSAQGFPVFLSQQLLNSFEPNDQRRAIWVGSIVVANSTYFYPYKYKSATLNAPLTEYEMVLRLGEQYLIRAEARAAQNNVGGAQSDLNVIRRRSGLPNTSANDQAALITAIAHERQVELFTEWGHRWLDLKRTAKVDSVLGAPLNVCAQKGGTWDPDWQWYPIPAFDIFEDPNLTQNQGY